MRASVLVCVRMHPNEFMYIFVSASIVQCNLVTVAFVFLSAHIRMYTRVLMPPSFVGTRKKPYCKFSKRLMALLREHNVCRFGYFNIFDDKVRL